jgi:glycosyltransferase involved in cell wall biosynthesis
MHRVSVVASHPIQYQAPWFRQLAEVTDLTVFFCHRQSAHDQARAGFGESFDWDVPLLDGYRYEFLENVSPTPGVDQFAGCDTPGLRHRLAAGRFDACIVNGWYLKSYLQAMRSARGLGMAVLVRGDSQLREARSALTSALKYFPYRWMLAQIDAHLFVGQANREYLEHYGVRTDSLFFAPHFVDNDRFGLGADRARESGEAAALRESWGAHPRAVIFGFAGKLVSGKRAGDFLAAIARLAKQDAGVRGVIVGAGPEADRLRERVDADKLPVVFTGFVNQSALPACYAAMDCLVVPSASESWGLVVNEAMASGRPVIVSDRVGCAADLVIEGETGFSYPMGDVAALTDRMLTLRRTIRERAVELAGALSARIGQYTCERAVAGTLEALDATAARVAVGAGRRHA